MTSATLTSTRPEPGAPRPWTFPTVTRVVLANGMAALLFDLPTRPITSVQLCLDAPRELEPEGLDGVAAITAEALREGTAHRDAEAFSEAVESRGATLGTHAGDAGIRVGVGVAVSRLEAALELVTEALTEPAFPAAEVERLVHQRLDAIALEQSDPGWRCGEAMMATLFDPTERLSRPGEGVAESVARIDRDAVVAFWAANGRPQGATVIMAGDLSGIDPVALLNRTLGAWTVSGGNVPQHRVPVAAPPAQAVVVHRPGAVQTEFRLARVGPNRHSPTWPATQLAAFSLGGSMSSRLMARLREEKGYTYGIHASASPMATTGILSIGSAVETGVTGAAVADTLAEVRRLVEEGVTDAERAFAADALTAGPRRMESAHQLAGLLAGVVEEGLPDDFVPRNLERLESTPTADVSARAAADWPADGLSLIAVGDADAIEGPLREIGFAGLRVDRQNPAPGRV